MRLLRKAAQEADAAFKWYWERNQDAALAFRAEVKRVLASVERDPLRWPHYLHGTRRALMRGFPYLIVFKVEPSEVIVVAISHQSRKPGYWKRRRT